ncbi:Cyclic di-GMP phosphodiesterase [subsurface metagenome]
MVITKESILIVDDEEEISGALSRRLSKQGYHCDVANSAEHALAKLNVNPSELVVLDTNMPGKLGIEVLSEIRVSFPETDVIMAGDITDTLVIAHYIYYGAQDYLCKPFRLYEVLLSVDRTLEKRRVQLQIQEHQQHPGQKFEEKVTEMREIFLNTIENLICRLEAIDQYMAGHSRKVSEIALAIGKQLGVPSDKLEDLHWGALLHDIGRIAIDKSILNKPGKLTPDEYRYILTHSLVSATLVKPFVNDRVVDIICHHHDHYDGSGLGQVVAGKDIPLGARIISVADAFNAMTSDRPYRDAMPRNEAIEEVKRSSGTQFDPMIARALVRIMANETMEANF